MKSLRNISTVALLLILFVIMQATTATAAGWLSGSFTIHNGTCSDLFGSYPYMITDESTGYYAADGLSPKVGDVYYTSVFVANVSPGAPCAAAAVKIELSLPPNTFPAISTNNPIKCYYTDTKGVRSQYSGSTANYACPSSAVAGTTNANSWDLGWATLPALTSGGSAWEVLMPVVSTKPLKGMAAVNDKLVAHVNMFAGNSSGSNHPYQYVTVFDNPPSIGYPSPSTTKITNTTLTTTAFLNNNYVGGTAFFEYGESPTSGPGSNSYPDISSSIPIDAANNYYPSIFADWTGVIPNTTGHWRMCFTPTGGTKTCGAEQTFTSLATLPSGVQWTLSTSSTTGGTTSPGGVYANGASANITATPGTGYIFSGWTLDDAPIASTSNPYSLPMNANHTMKGNFSVNPNVAFALLTITPSTGGSAAATPGGGSYATGTSVSLTATPAANYTFSSWTVDSVSAGSTNPYVITMNGNHVVQANFTAIPAATYTLTVTPATGGTVTPTPSGTSFAPGATVSLAAVATPGFTFSGWTVDSANGGTTNPLSITMSANHTVLPTFTVIPAATYTLAVTPATGGTITPTPSGTSFAAGATVSLAAAATPGFTFSGWTVDGASGGAANPLSITMSGNHTVKANFTANAAADTTGPTLTISSLNNGAVTGNATLNVAGTVSDASGVASLTVNNVAVTITSGNFSYPFTLSAGPNIITTVATDTPGNKTTDTRTITLSSSAPSLNVSTPADNSKTAQSVATVSGTTSANTTVAVKVNSGTAQNAAITGSNFSATVNLTVGINTIDITATNTTAQTSNAKRTVTYDNSAPSLSVTSPAQDISTTLSSITISGTVSDSLTTVTIKIAADGQNYAPAIAQNGGFSQLIPLPTDKTYAVVVTATDEAGNNINVTRNVIRSAQLTQPTINDAIKVLLDVAGTTPLNAADKLRFDVAPLDNSGVPKGDGNIDDADVILILRRSIGIGSW